MENDLTQGRVSRALLAFVLPFLGATVLQFLYSVVDMIIVGRFSTTAAISAVNTSGQIIQLVTQAVTGICTGGTVLIAQAVGAKDNQSVRSTVRALFSLFIILTIILTVFLLACGNLLIQAMQVPEAAVEPARAYLRICSCGMLFVIGFNGISAILRGFGNSRHPMLIITCSCVLNIIGDLILVGACRLGAAGAALATVGAQAIACVVALIIYARSSLPVDPISRSFTFPRSILSVLRVGVPVAAQDAPTSLSFLIITAVVNSIGLDQSAAVGIIERVISFCMLVPIAFLSALSAFTAQNYGAGETQRTKEGLRLSILFSLAATVVFCGALELFPATVMHLFTLDEAVTAFGTAYVRTYGIDIILVSLVFCLNGFYMGFGKTTFTMTNALVSTFIIRVPLVFLMSRIPDVSLTLIGIAAPAASFCQIVMQLFYYRFGSWGERDKARLCEEAT